MRSGFTYMAIGMMCAALAFAAFTGCEQEGPAEQLGKNVDEAVEEAGDRAEEAAETMEETVETAGDKLEEAGDKAEKATD